MYETVVFVVLVWLWKFISHTSWRKYIEGVRD